MAKNKSPSIQDTPCMSPKRPLWCKTDSPCAVNRSVARVESRTILYAVYFHSRYMEIAIDDRSKRGTYREKRYDIIPLWIDGYATPTARRAWKIKTRVKSQSPYLICEQISQREPIIAYGIVPVAAKCRGVRVGDAIPARGGEEGTKKLTCRVDGARDRARERGKKERYIYISERLKALEFLHGEVRGAICGALRMFHYRGSVHRSATEFRMSYRPGREKYLRARLSAVEDS